MADEIKKSKSRVKKEQLVAEMAEKVQKSKALYFLNYQGMTHPQLEAFKKILKTTKAEFVVTKNTLLQRALGISNIEYRISNLDGPTATLFAYEDAISPLKELAKTIRLLKLPTVKFGILENKVLEEQEVLRLSTLPSREVLLAQLVGMLNSPIQGLHTVLSTNIQKFVLTLKAIETKKGGDL